jgi:uncharacterized membrane protein YbhN (UPF0104 family)
MTQPSTDPQRPFTAGPTPGPLTRLTARLRRIAASPVFRTVLSLAFFAAAVAIVVREFGHLSWAQVAASIRATPAWAIWAAIGLTVAGYACLGAIEVFTLRWLSRPLGWLTTAAVGAAGYAVGNTVGFSAASGAAVRLRLYSPLGLGAVDSVKITFVSGLAVSLGGIIAAGGALVAAPDVFARAMHGPVTVIIGLGVVLIAPAALWFVAFRRGSPVWLGGGEAPPPGAGERTAALAAAIADWVLSCGVLYILMPHPSLAGYTPFLAVFVLGTLVSAASGVPGGIGVFEAVVLAISQVSSQMQETAAALLLYRLIYCLGPTSLVVAGLAVRQGIDIARRRRAAA